MPRISAPSAPFLHERDLRSSGMDFTPWVRHFERNGQRQRRWRRRSTGPSGAGWTRRAALIRSFQRFELGKRGTAAPAGQGRNAPATRSHARAGAAGGRGAAALGPVRPDWIDLGGKPLAGHRSNPRSTALRRALGLRTELGLFLVAEAVAIEYFTALATGAPIRCCGHRPRLEHDERDHLRFQVDRLVQGWAGARWWCARPCGWRCSPWAWRDGRAGHRPPGGAARLRRNLVGYAWRALRRLQPARPGPRIESAVGAAPCLRHGAAVHDRVDGQPLP